MSANAITWDQVKHVGLETISASLVSPGLVNDLEDGLLNREDVSWDQVFVGDKMSSVFLILTEFYAFTDEGNCLVSRVRELEEVCRVVVWIGPQVPLKLQAIALELHQGIVKRVIVVSR